MTPRDMYGQEQLIAVSWCRSRTLPCHQPLLQPMAGSAQGVVKGLNLNCSCNGCKRQRGHPFSFPGVFYGDFLQSSVPEVFDY